MKDEERIRERDGIVIIRIAGEVGRKSRGRSARNAESDCRIFCGEDVIKIKISAHRGCAAIEEHRPVYPSFVIRKCDEEGEGSREVRRTCRNSNTALHRCLAYRGV